jgi:imidazolonepropionase-like amidohydrolase
MPSPWCGSERILCAGAAGECSVPQGAKVIEARGQYLIPGLIDSHVHLLFLQNGSAVEDLGLDLRDLLAQGITTVRDMGTNPVALLARIGGFDAAPRVVAISWSRAAGSSTPPCGRRGASAASSCARPPP